MPRYVKIILWVCLGVILSLVLAGAVVATFDWNHAKPWLNRQATEIAGRPVAIEGDLRVHWRNAGTESGWRGWMPWPEITATNLTVANPQGVQSDKAMAKVTSVTVLLNPVALLARTVQIADLKIDEADLFLERRSDGTANWTFKKDESKSPSKWKVDLQKVSLARVHAQVVDAASKLDLKTDLDTLQERSQEGYGIGWKASGTYNEAEISGEGKTGGILSLTQGSEPFPLRGSVNVGTTTIGIEGSVTRPQALASLDVRLKLAGDTMADLFPLVGVALPDTPPYSTEGHLIGMLEGDDDTWKYEEFKGRVGKSDLQGSLTYQIREPRPLLSGNVESMLLRLKDLGPIIGADTSDVKGAKKTKTRQPAGKALPVRDVNTEVWGAMDADVQFKGKKILRDKDLPLDNIEAHIKLTDRVLNFTPLNFGVAGGTLGNTLTLDGRGDKIKATLKTAARHLKLKKLFPGAESMNASFGELHGDAELTAQGDSISEMMAHSNGEIKALVSRGTVSHYLLEAAGLNVANMIMVKLFGDEQIVLNCLASDFAVKDGLMRVRAFRLETDDAVVDISGQINLATERIDLEIKPENKTVRIFTLRSPLYAKGSFKNPDVGVQKGPLLARAGAAVALGIVATPFAALLPLLNVGTDDSSGCSLVVAAAKEAPDAPPPGKSGVRESTVEAGAAAQAEKGETRKPDGEKSGTKSERENWPSSQALP